MPTELASLRLFQLISPALPIGAFTYSQGMEWAVENAWIKTPKDLSGWLYDVLQDSLVWLELPLMQRLYRAAEKDDAAAFFHWSQYLLASRETRELREEEKHRARAMLAGLEKLPDVKGWQELLTWREALLKSQAASFALAAARWKIPCQQAMQGYAWSWLENAVTVAVKLVPLGQSDGQVILHQLSEHIPPAIQAAMTVSDEDIGASTPAMAIASSLHEVQYSRLFRS